MFITSLFVGYDLRKMKEAGIGAVIVGGENFAIASPLCLDKRELERLMIEAQELQMEVHVLCNRILFDEDIPVLTEYLKYLKKIAVDVIYYGDVAVHTIGKELDLLEQLVFMPGYILTNSQDIKAYLKQGIQRIEIANELTLEEKLAIADACPHQVQVVLHGHLMMSYSRREFISNYFSEIGNSNDPKNDFNYYLVEETRENPMPILETEYGTMIYSPYVVKSFHEIKQLSERVSYFRIEGLFLGQAYLIDVVKAYQRILAGDDEVEVEREFLEKYPHVIHESGFYYQKTNLVK
jgi:Collagenase and related proteases